MSIPHVTIFSAITSLLVFKRCARATANCCTASPIVSDTLGGVLRSTICFFDCAGANFLATPFASLGLLP